MQNVRLAVQRMQNVQVGTRRMQSVRLAAWRMQNVRLALIRIPGGSGHNCWRFVQLGAPGSVCNPPVIIFCATSALLERLGAAGSA